MKTKDPNKPLRFDNLIPPAVAPAANPGRMELSGPLSTHPEDPVESEPLKPKGSLGRISLSDGEASAWAEPEYVLKLAGVYQDATTREWATQVAEQAIQVVGERYVRSTWWRMGELKGRQLLLDAVQAAVAADALIVSVRAGDKVPFDLYEWAEAWVPRRLPLGGALVALIGAPEHPGADTCRLRCYLQEVARRAQLEFLPQEQKLPVEFSNFSMKEVAEKTLVPGERFDHDH